MQLLQATILAWHAVANASRTCLMDLHSRAWSDECLHLFGISRAALPTIVSNAEEYGRVAAGPLAGVPICGSLGDQQAALLGANRLSLALRTRSAS